RTASPTPAAQLPRVLQRHSPASGPPEQQPPPAPSASTSARAYRRDPAGRRTSSPVSSRRLSAAGFTGRLRRQPRGCRQSCSYPRCRSVFLQQSSSEAAQAGRLGPPVATSVVRQFLRKCRSGFLTGTPDSCPRRQWVLIL